MRVRLGERVGDVVEVLDGVKPGDRVVASGAGFLAEGDHVRVVATP
jgi:multidrug efflux pump subunit AcrA (membrane-fusion protein)